MSGLDVILKESRFHIYGIHGISERIPSLVIHTHMLNITSKKKINPLWESKPEKLPRNLEEIHPRFTKNKNPKPNSQNAFIKNFHEIPNSQNISLKIQRKIKKISEKFHSIKTSWKIVSWIPPKITIISLINIHSPEVSKN